MTAKKKANRADAKVKSSNLESGDVVEEILSAVGAEDGAQILGSNQLNIKIKGIVSTQCATVDAAIGRGGIPRGRLTIIHGPEGCGKTTLCGHIVAETQRIGGVAVYYDKEYKLDPDYFQALGVDINRMIISQPPYLERFFESLDSVIDKVIALREHKGVRIPVTVILDSMNAAISKMEFKGEYDDQHYAPQARVFSSSLPKIMPRVSKEDIALVFISQTRTNIGQSFGDSDTICGGKAPKFYASLIMKIARTKSLSKDGEKIGSEVEVTCAKNQIAMPFKKGLFEITYGRGIDKNVALFEQAIKNDVIIQKGAWYEWRGTSIGQGRDASLVALVDNGWVDDLYADVAEKNNWHVEESDE